MRLYTSGKASRIHNILGAIVGWPEPVNWRIGSWKFVSVQLSWGKKRVSSVVVYGVVASPSSSMPIVPLIIPSRQTAATSAEEIPAFCTSSRVES